MKASLFSLGIGLRAALLAAIAFAVIQLVATGHLYATAFVVAAIGALVLADLARYVAKGDRMLARFVEGLAGEDFGRPLHGRAAITGFRRLDAAIDRAIAALTASRAATQRNADYLRTLIDNLSAALFMVGLDGEIELANRSGHLLAASHARRLQECPAVGAAAAARLIALRPGGREILRLANGQRVLASAASFSAGGASRRLISLENIDSELDEVELKAWQDLVRILSHEMMNSLTPIASLASSLRPLFAQGVAWPADIDAAIETIARRSSGLMSFVERYRKMADLPEPLLRAVPLAGLLARIGQLMGATLANRGIGYSIRVEPGDLAIQADPELIEQALLNLLHNAVDAVAAVTEPRIEVICEQRGDRVAIAISDNGKGFEADSVDRIFVPFFTTKSGGSGIGLSLARQIALAHHGQLEARPGSLRGAVFTLHIPTPGTS